MIMKEPNPGNANEKKKWNNRMKKKKIMVPNPGSETEKKVK